MENVYLDDRIGDGT